MEATVISLLFDHSHEQYDWNNLGLPLYDMGGGGGGGGSGGAKQRYV